MKNKFIRYLEVFAGSSFVFTIAGYFCGYVIMASFLKSMFGLPFVTGIVFPPQNIIFLGYMLILSFLIALPILWDFSIKRDFEDAKQVVFVFLVSIFLSKFNFSLNFFRFNIPSFLVKIFLFFLLCLTLGLSSIALRKFFKKHTNFIPRLSNYFPVSTIAIIFAMFLPTLSLLSSSSSPITDVDLISFMFSFYAEYIYTLTFLSISLISCINYINARKETKEVFISVFKLAIVFLVFIYQFSTVVGNAIAKSYVKDNKGIFSNAVLVFNKEIEIDGNKMMKLSNIKFLAKDNNNYYVFNVNPNRLYSINVNDVSYIHLLGNTK